MSSAIASISYDKETKELTVVFVKGGSHAYSNVPESVVTQFKNAASQGKYFNDNVKFAY